MYKKATAVELQFSPDRLNDGAGDPFWIDLNHHEAVELHQALQRYLDTEAAVRPAPLVVSLDKDGSADEAASAEPNGASGSQVNVDDFKQWVCVICGWVYDEAAGLPDEGLAPGTRWADVPDDWRCPLCDVGKEDFALVEF